MKIYYLFPSLSLPTFTTLFLPLHLPLPLSPSPPPTLHPSSSPPLFPSTFSLGPNLAELLHLHNPLLGLEESPPGHHGEHHVVYDAAHGPQLKVPLLLQQTLQVLTVKHLWEPTQPPSIMGPSTHPIGGVGASGGQHISHQRVNTATIRGSTHIPSGGQHTSHQGVNTHPIRGSHQGANTHPIRGPTLVPSGGQHSSHSWPNIC